MVEYGTAQYGTIYCTRDSTVLCATVGVYSTVWTTCGAFENSFTENLDIQSIDTLFVRNVQVHIG